MSTPPLPTPYELCRIAAALGANEAKKTPVKAVRQAVNLWSAAVGHLSKAMKEFDAEAHAARSEEWERTKEIESNDTIGSILHESRSGHESEAFEWVNKYAMEKKRKRDEFKSLNGFKVAWANYAFRYRLSPEVPDDHEAWLRFMTDRFEKRRTDNRISKRQKRAGKK
jgi:hypothetical protein